MQALFYSPKKIPLLDYLYFSIHRLPAGTIRPPSSHPRVTMATAAFARSIRRMDFSGSRLWELSAVGQIGIAALEKDALDVFINSDSIGMKSELYCSTMLTDGS